MAARHTSRSQQRLEEIELEPAVRFDGRNRRIAGAADAEIVLDRWHGDIHDRVIDDGSDSRLSDDGRSEPIAPTSARDRSFFTHRQRGYFGHRSREEEAGRRPGDYSSPDGPYRTRPVPRPCSGPGRSRPAGSYPTDPRVRPTWSQHFTLVLGGYGVGTSSTEVIRPSDEGRRFAAMTGQSGPGAFGCHRRVRDARGPGGGRRIVQGERRR